MVGPRRRKGLALEEIHWENWNTQYAATMEAQKELHFHDCFKLSTSAIEGSSCPKAKAPATLAMKHHQQSSLAWNIRLLTLAISGVSVCLSYFSSSVLRAWFRCGIIFQASQHVGFSTSPCTALARRVRPAPKSSRASGHMRVSSPAKAPREPRARIARPDRRETLGTEWSVHDLMHMTWR